MTWNGSLQRVLQCMRHARVVAQLRHEPDLPRKGHRAKFCQCPTFLRVKGNAVVPYQGQKRIMLVHRLFRQQRCTGDLQCLGRLSFTCNNRAHNVRLR